MRADAAPFVPSVLLNSSTCAVDESTGQQLKKEQQRQRQRRRRRRQCKKQQASSDKDESPPHEAKQNEPPISSQTTQKQKLQQHRKRRSRRRKPTSSHSSEDTRLQSLNCKKYSEQKSLIVSTEQNTNHQDGINYDEDCFPILARKFDDTCTTTNTLTDSSWGECLVAKLAISEMEKQHQQQEANYDQDEFGLQFNSDVQLTTLSRSSRQTSKDDATETKKYGHSETKDNIENVIAMEDENENCVFVPNAKWKWNDTQLSKMRQRWWSAVKDKQTKDAARVKQYKSMASLRRVVLEDDNSTSSDSSSLFSMEDDDPFQPPSLSKPFDEMTIEQSNSTHLDQRSLVPVSVLDLETMCCGTAHPLHTVIYLHALQNPFVSERVLGDSKTSKSDSEIVLHRLLTLQDQDDIDRWRIDGVGLDEICQISTPSNWIKNLFSSVEEITSVGNELTPLQLAILLDCPDIVRALRSGKSTFSLSSKNESEQDCTSLMLACELGHAACIKALLCSSNIKLDYRERETGNTAYHFCCLGRMASTTDDDVINTNNNVSALDTLINHTPNALRKRVLLLTNREGRNVAHIACARGDLLLLKCVIGHLSNVSSQMPWKALTATDRLLGHTPFSSAVFAGKCDIVAHLLVTRFPAADYSVLFSECPLTIAASNFDTAMAALLFEMGYDSQTMASSEISQIIRYDINRSLLELMLISCGMESGEEMDPDYYEFIRLLVANGANPHKGVSIRNQQKPKTRGDDTIPVLAGEEETALTVAVMASDYQSIESMLHSYMHALTATQSLRRKDPLLISQPESYFRAVEERETDTIQHSLQSALVKALFLLWQSGDVNIGKCCLVLYRRGVSLSLMSLQWLEKCILANRFVVPSSSWGDSISGYYFEAPLVQYSLPKAAFDTTEATNPYANVGAFMCWSHVLLELPWVNRFSFNCKWIRNEKNSDFDCDTLKATHLLEDEFYLVVEKEKLLVHKSIISAKSGKLAAAIHFMEAQGHGTEEGKMCVSIDLPLLLAKMLVCHIYHGSISFGLMASPLKRSEQLLELALVAEEYLCPSLLMEVEMRMLETKNDDCFCAYCSGAAMTPKDESTCPIAIEFLDLAEQNTDDSHSQPSGIYFYKASHFNVSSLISPESAINVLAVAQQLNLSSSSENGSYALKYTTKPHDESVASTEINVNGNRNAGVLTAPFLACRIVASVTLLRDFKLFMEQAEKDDDADDIPLLTGRERHSEVDESCILLLRSCIEELAQNSLRPPKIMMNQNSRKIPHIDK